MRKYLIIRLERDTGVEPASQAWEAQKQACNCLIISYLLTAKNVVHLMLYLNGTY